MLLVLSVMLVSCSGDDEPASNTLIIGESTSADFFQSFIPPRTLTLVSEERSSGYNAKEYQDSLDLNQDGTIDMVLYYSIGIGINGDSLITTGIARQTDQVVLLGDSVEWNGDFYWDRALFSKGETIGLDLGYWQVTSQDGYVFDSYRYDSNSQETYKRTAFPGDHSGYMVFQYNTGDDILLGWLELSITGALRAPQTDSYGYKIIPKTD